VPVEEFKTSSNHTPLIDTIKPTDGKRNVEKGSSSKAAENEKDKADIENVPQRAPLL
jgi:hypothetical protein